MIGTHRNQYGDLQPNHMYMMRRTARALRRCWYVEDVDIGESRRAMEVGKGREVTVSGYLKFISG